MNTIGEGRVKIAELHGVRVKDGVQMVLLRLYIDGMRVAEQVVEAGFVERNKENIL